MQDSLNSSSACGKAVQAHTPGPWSVRQAWTQGRDGNPRRCGWHLMNGSEWAQIFPRRRDAQAEADRLNAVPGMAAVEQCAPCRAYDADAVCPRCRVIPAAIARAEGTS